MIYPSEKLDIIQRPASELRSDDISTDSESVPIPLQIKPKKKGKIILQEPETQEPETQEPETQEPETQSLKQEFENSNLKPEPETQDFVIESLDEDE